MNSDSPSGKENNVICNALLKMIMEMQRYEYYENHLHLRQMKTEIPRIIVVYLK